MRDGWSESIELPNGDHMEATAIGICHQLVEFWPGIRSAGDSFVHLLASGLATPPGTREIEVRRRARSGDGQQNGAPRPSIEPLFHIEPTFGQTVAEVAS